MLDVSRVWLSNFLWYYQKIQTHFQRVKERSFHGDASLYKYYFTMQSSLHSTSYVLNLEPKKSFWLQIDIVQCCATEWREHFQVLPSLLWCLSLTINQSWCKYSNRVWMVLAAFLFKPLRIEAREPTRRESVKIRHRRLRKKVQSGVEADYCAVWGWESVSMKEHFL